MKRPVEKTFKYEKEGQWTVRQATTGVYREWYEMFASMFFTEHATFRSNASAHAWLAWKTYGGTTICWEDDDGEKTPILPEPNEIKSWEEFIAYWDMLPSEFTDWVIERVYEVNPTFRSVLTPDEQSAP